MKRMGPATNLHDLDDGQESRYGLHPVPRSEERMRGQVGDDGERSAQYRGRDGSADGGDIFSHVALRQKRYAESMPNKGQRCHAAHELGTPSDEVKDRYGYCCLAYCPVRGHVCRDTPELIHIAALEGCQALLLRRRNVMLSTCALVVPCWTQLSGTRQDECFKESQTQPRKNTRPCAPLNPACLA
jgi:hypothetical protein